ncbi:sulfur carrier protein ThiS [Hoeflea sp. CAU 1731]
MELTVNGERQDISASTLADLMDALDYRGEWLATAVNGELVKASRRSSRILNEGDRIEILSPMKGG